MEVAATQCLIGGEGHVRQADLSMCLIRCKVFAEVLTFFVSPVLAENSFKTEVSFVVSYYHPKPPG